MTGNPCSVRVTRNDGTAQLVSGPMPLKDAADAAFRLAEELGLPGTRSDIREIAILWGDELQLSIAIEPGVPLTGP